MTHTNKEKKCSAGSDLSDHCSGCTDPRSEGTHQGCTKEHGHVGCSLETAATDRTFEEKCDCPVFEAGGKCPHVGYSSPWPKSKAEVGDWRERFDKWIAPKIISGFYDKADVHYVADFIATEVQRAYEEGANLQGLKIAGVFKEQFIEQGKQAMREEYKGIFSWLLGETDFRGREEGEGAYWWRNELRKRLKDTGSSNK